MDLNNKEAKCFIIEEIVQLNSCLSSISLTVSGIHRAVLENNLKTVKHLLNTGKCVNIKEEEYGFTPLHLAVIKDSMEILDYLLFRDDIEVDARCSGGDTPLQTASSLGAYHTVKKLIEAGANVNLCNDKDVSPLHTSVPYPDNCHILIQNNAHIDAVDSNGLTALHHAVQLEFLETTYMLLYYNADANVPDEKGYTPFMFAIRYGKTEAQRVLLDYVVDFNAVYDDPRSSNTLLGLALLNESPLVEEIVDRGADVNYADSACFSEQVCAFVMCVNFIRDKAVFKIVWDGLRCYQTKRAINMCKLFEINDKSYLTNVFRIIIESDNLEVAVDSFRSSDYGFCVFVNFFLLYGLEMEQLVDFTYRLLEYGYRPTIDDIHNVFSEYGCCELRRVLSYMDIDYGPIACPETMTYLRPTFDLDFDAVVLAQGVDSGECVLTSEEVVLFLGQFRDPCLVSVLRLKFGDDERLSGVFNGLDKVASLVELARNEARKYVRERFRVANVCQFHTIVDYLAIPSFYKDILTYKRKIYSVKM